MKFPCFPEGIKVRGQDAENKDRMPQAGNYNGFDAKQLFLLRLAFKISTIPKKLLIIIEVIAKIRIPSLSN